MKRKRIRSTRRPGPGMAVAAVTAATVALQELAARQYFRTTPGPTQAVDPEERTAWTAPAHEAWTPVEWLALRMSSVYRGHGVPRGDGAPVVLVAGFMTKGHYLETLRGWLERIGYRARIADIGWNTDCVDVMTGRLLDELGAVNTFEGRPAHLVGHSLGGLMARAVATRTPDLIASVTTIAAPFRGMRVHPMLRLGAAVVRRKVHGQRDVPDDCLTLACPCPTIRALHEALPLRVPRLAIVAQRDGLVDPRYCKDDELSGRVVEVPASHVGAVMNVETYRALAFHFAGAGRMIAHTPA